MRTCAWTLVISTIFFLGVGFAADQPEVKEEKDRISYSVGHQVGGDFKRQGVELNPDLFVKGVRDAMSGAKPLMTQQEMNKTLVDLKKKIVAEEQRQKKEAAGKNLQEGKAFLAENARKKDVRTLPSGLQYQVIEKGTGASPKKTDSVTVDYKGTLIDGTEFDSSYKRGKPATFRVDGVIAGWTEALQLMKPGAKWRLFIPPDLAYGERGAGSRIGPNSALIFEVELISVAPSK
ncbi:MAG: FKBP-type peptidyl-prolyl cis-trans isomerase, FKBP-type peptidyl-prolyl cis-trans isomerase FklB [Deltaproteobacteria bacterium CSP1-8]|nr:MAG: FKBP-type peptidyl-prolyl cis-trans isomerase, FKBP-type peptidyl-prolyl cis-trans isomerase FklB [Deltaproteobacteria bacterium CSP1-8]